MSYIGSVPTTAAFPFDQFSGNGTTTAFTLTYAPASTTSIIVAISGVVQNPNLYSVIGTTITFSPAPPTGTNNISVLYLGLPVQIGTPIPGSTLELALGSAANPSLTFLGDTNTGIFSPAADTIAFAEGGTEVGRFDSSGNLLIGNAIAGSISPALRIGNSGSGGGVVTATLSLGSYSTGYGSNIISSTDFNSSTASYLAFGTTAVGASGLSAPVERMRIDSSGNLLVGQTAANSGAGITLYKDSTRGIVQIRTTTTAADAVSEFFNPNGKVGQIFTSGSSTSYATSSDYRLKENVQLMTGALARVAALKPCTYTWKADGSDGEGFIAHELAEVCPSAVTGEKDAVNEDGSIKPQGIDTSFLVATLTAAIQELKAELDATKAEVALLKGAA